MSLDYNIKEYLRGLSDEDLTEVSVLLEGLRLRKKYSECPYKNGESYIQKNKQNLNLEECLKVGFELFWHDKTFDMLINLFDLIEILFLDRN